MCRRMRVMCGGVRMMCRRMRMVRVMCERMKVMWVPVNMFSVCVWVLCVSSLNKLSTSILSMSDVCVFVCVPVNKYISVLCVCVCVVCVCR